MNCGVRRVSAFAPLDEEPMRANPYLRRAAVNFGNRAGAGSAYLLIALMTVFVIAELFFRIMRAYF